jgi:hypothetical protein
MMATRIRNTSAAGTAPAAPSRPDGQPYDLEMIHDGGRWRSYADTAAELTGLLIAGYGQLEDADARLTARIRYAADTHVPIQAGFAADGDLDACAPGELTALLGARDTPPAPASWDAPVPLVLVTSFYAPAGPLARPAAGKGEIVWIDPESDKSLLSSLHEAGWITLSRRDAAGEPGGTGR